MGNPHKYRAYDKMSDLIGDNHHLLLVMSRFGLHLGFGDKTVQEACEEQGVHCATFLAVANFINEKQHDDDDEALSLPALIAYLKRAHSYFLDFKLPTIRRRLIEAIDCSGIDNVAFLILKFFDEYAGEVRRHMEQENQEVFAYAEQLAEGRLADDYSIERYSAHHDHMESKLAELKKIIVKYYPERGDNHLLHATLFDIFNCEEDLTSHREVEERLFVPAALQLEEQLRAELEPKEETHGTESGAETEALSDREREIIVCVVKGMTNKAIADQLCLSVHTVLTHRRNIARKLQIHSPAGLTIYAIVNKLVEIGDITL